MSKKRKSGDTASLTDSNCVDDLITPQYRHIKELSALKYEAEEKREQNLIQQSSQMQTVFSFMTAAIFMAVPICIEHRGALSLEFFLVSISIIVSFSHCELSFSITCTVALENGNFSRCIANQR